MATGAPAMAPAPSADLEKTSVDNKELHEPGQRVHPDGGGADDKHGFGDELIEDLAQRGHAAPTDGLGHSLVVVDPAAERRLRWKMDLHIMPLVMLMYLWCFIDRANVGNARLYGLEKDLGMAGYDFNVAQTVFYVSYVVLEYPVVMAAKVIGPGRWIPTLVFAFGIVSLTTAFVHTFAQLCGVRFLLGLFESGLLPGLAYYLSRWYRKGELVFRISMYIAMAPLAGAFGGLLAYGIVNDISHIGWLTTWRMLFFVEGIVTAALGLFCFFTLTDRPGSARWLTHEEKALAEARLKVDTVAITETLEAVRRRTVWSGLRSLNVWLIGFVLLLNSALVQGIAVFLPTIITAQYPNDTAVRRNLLTVPCYITGLLWVLASSYLAWRTRKHALWLIVSAPLSIIGYSLFLAAPTTGGQYTGAFFVAAGNFPYGAIGYGWISANLAPDAARASGIALAAVFQNLGGLVSNWIYLSPAAPKYTAGHSVNIAFSAICGVTVALIWAYQWRENRLRRAGKRDQRLEGLSDAEVAVLGHCHPRFYYTY